VTGTINPGTIGTERYCIGDQIDWPKAGLAYDPVDYSVVTAVSYYQGSGLGNLISLGQYAFSCPVDGGPGGLSTEGTGLNPGTCINGNDDPCVCGTEGCNALPNGYEDDQILPQVAYNENGNGTDNELSLTWYDNTGRLVGAYISAFGSVLGRSSADGGASHLVSQLQPGFAVIEPFTREVDASAKANTQIGLSPRNGSDEFFGASHGTNEVLNQQWATQ
jgi:hypothetical protein